MSYSQMSSGPITFMQTAIPQPMLNFIKLLDWQDPVTIECITEAANIYYNAIFKQAFKKCRHNGDHVYFAEQTCLWFGIALAIQLKGIK